MKLASAFQRFRARSPEERRLLMGTAALFMMAHPLLRATSLRRTRTILTYTARALHVRAQHALQLKWAINAVTNNAPGRHSCLVQAACCEAIARQSGLDVELMLGAARGPGGMHFHAWVEHAGAIIAGEHHGEFTPLR